MPAAVSPPVRHEPTTQERKHHRRWLLPFELIALTVVAVLFLEWFLGACGVGQQEFLQPDPQLGCRHIPGKLVTWRLEGFSSDHLSSTGLRDVEHAIAKPAGVTRIALLGDSGTEGLQVPLDETFARRLERQLNQAGPRKYEVLNFATSSYSTGQQLLQFKREVVPYKPDLAIVLYNRGDSVENIRNPFAHGTEPRPYFYFDQTGQFRQDDGALKENAANLNPGPLSLFLRRHSRIYGVFSQTNLALSLNEKFYRKLRGWVLSLFSIGHTKDRSAPTVAYELQDPWKVTSELIGRLNDACRSNDCKLLIVAFPNMVDDPDYGTQSINLERQSKKEKFGYLDLTAIFKADPNPRSLFFQVHLSSPGHKIVADELAKRLLSESAN